jgi:hypothetical protein
MERKQNTSKYDVPAELLADILRILIRNKIAYQVEGVKSRANIILLSVKYTQGDRQQVKAQENIEAMLADFTEYMEGLSDAILYSDESE